MGVTGMGEQTRRMSSRSLVRMTEERQPLTVTAAPTWASATLTRSRLTMSAATSPGLLYSVTSLTGNRLMADRVGGAIPPCFDACGAGHLDPGQVAALVPGHRALQVGQNPTVLGVMGVDQRLDGLDVEGEDAHAEFSD